MIFQGSALEAVVRYLDTTVSDHMGLGHVNEVTHRASKNTVDAIAAYVARVGS